MPDLLKFETHQQRSLGDIIGMLKQLHETDVIKGIVVVTFTEEDSVRQGVTDWFVEESGDVATAALLIQGDYLRMMANG
tara:strand:+ start:552 stop:788 length:237 start_codon:yes stop_codon:yes gene_type:complete